MSFREKKQVFIVEDHPILADGISRLINAQSDLVCCGTLSRYESAFEEIEKKRPDLILLDIGLSNSESIKLTQQLAEHYPKIKIVIISMQKEELYAEQTLCCGASGFVSMDAQPEELLKVVRQVCAGEVCFTETIRSRLWNRRFLAPIDNHHAPISSLLSERELQIFRLIGEGHRTGEIARSLEVSVKTIQSHREHIKDKLGIHSASELAWHAINWVQTENPKTA